MKSSGGRAQKNRGRKRVILPAVLYHKQHGAYLIGPGGLKEFCGRFRLNQGALSRVLRGSMNTHKDWRGEYVTTEFMCDLERGDENGTEKETGECGI